jgi:hypothetical protein
MTKDEALKLAVDGLQEIALAGMSPPPEMSEDGIHAWHARQAWNFIGIAARQLAAIKAVEQTHCQCKACINGNIHDSDCSVHNGDALPEGPCDCRLAALAQPVQEPSQASYPEYDRGFSEGWDRCKAAAQRPWVGLTDGEIQVSWDEAMDGAVFTRRNVYNAIEAKLKEKNFD